MSRWRSCFCAKFQSSSVKTEEDDRQTPVVEAAAVGERSSNGDIPGWKFPKGIFVGDSVQTKFQVPLKCLECLFEMQKQSHFWLHV